MLKKLFLIWLASSVLFAPLSAYAGSVKSATSHHCRMNSGVTAQTATRHEHECHDCAGCETETGQCQNGDCGMASCTVSHSPVALSLGPHAALFDQLSKTGTPRQFSLSNRNEPPLLRPPIRTIA